MKKYPKPIQSDERGQLVIPRDIRNDLSLEEGSGLFLYTITNEGILLKKIEAQPLGSHLDILNEVEQKATKIGIKRENLKKAIKNYEKVKEGKLELI